VNESALQSLLEDVLHVRSLYLAHNGYFRGCCPLHDEHNPSFGVNTRSSVHFYKCWVCGTGNLQTLVAAVLNVGAEDALKIIHRYGDYSVPQPDWLPVLPDYEKHFFTEQKVREIPVYLLAPYMGKQLKRCAAVMHFAPSYCRKVGLGFDSIRKRVLFPWFFNGKLFGVTGRVETDFPGMPKTLPYFGTEKGKILYVPGGCFQKDKPAALGEGERDGLSLYRFFPNACAVGSSTLSEQQARILTNHFQEVMVFRDPGSKGDPFVQSVKRRLMGKVKVSVCGHDTFDPGAMKPAEILRTASCRSLLF